MLKSIIAAAAACATLALSAVVQAAAISGAGATFPAPVYAKWAEGYRAQTGQLLNYQPIGSGGGIKQIEAGTVDFGASDKPLKPDVLAANGLVQFPTVVGGVVPVVNIPGVAPGALRLTGPILADIYRGVDRFWDAPVIKSYNPNLRLPHIKITVIHRSDGSGTTFLYTSFLSMQAPHWAKDVGASDAVNWPSGQGGKGNDGVAALVKQTPGSIGYVEYAYAKQNRMSYAVLKNRAGGWVAPTAANFAAAAAGARWGAAPGFYLLLLDQPGARAWPITGATFILMHARQTNPANGKAVLSFFDWTYKNGDSAAAQLDYVPLPAPVKALIRKSWSRISGAGGAPVYR